SGHDVLVLGWGDWANDGLDGLRDFLLHPLVSSIPRREGHIHVRDPSTQVIGNGHHRRFRDLLHRQTGGFELLRAQTMASHIDDVIHPAQNAIVAILRLHGAITSEIRPVAPVFAGLVFAILGAIRCDKALAITPDSLEGPWPWVAYTDIAGFTGAGGELMAILIVDDRVNARHSGASTARLHGLQRRHGAAEETAGLGLPPGVHDDSLALANGLVIPQPHFRLDRLTHGRHVIEVVGVLWRLIRSG